MTQDVQRDDPPFVRSAWNYITDFTSELTGLDCSGDPSLAQQQFKDECDINVIVERFGLTGEMPLNPQVPKYGDFTGVYDFQSALNAINQAEASFMELPAKVRARFENDPQQLLEFVSDEKNREEAQSLGLLKITPPEAVKSVASPPPIPPSEKSEEKPAKPSK